MASSRVRRYVLAASGPILVAAINFLLSLTMLKLASPAGFGTFVFLFTAAMFLIAVSSALFAAPMQASLASNPEVAATMIGVTRLVALLVAPAYAGLGRIYGLGLLPALAYGAFAALTIVRTLGRAWCYARDQPGRVAASDALYTVVTAGTFAGGVLIFGHAAATAVFPALALGVAGGTLALGGRFLALLIDRRAGAVSGYRAIWQGQSRWSLLAVTTNELTANAHIYLLTLLSGAAAVAPIAASALLMRPINVVQNALAEFERGQMAGLLARRATPALRRAIRFFRIVLLVAWGMTALLAAAILAFDPRLILPSDYDLALLSLAVGLWAAVWLITVLQLPENVLLQAGGRFRELSRASVMASGVSVAGVLIAIALNQPVWTIAALIPGWLTCLAIVHRAARDFRRTLQASARGG